jgi:hypothetical protein
MPDYRFSFGIRVTGEIVVTARDDDRARATARRILAQQTRTAKTAGSVEVTVSDLFALAARRAVYVLGGTNETALALVDPATGGIVYYLSPRDDPRQIAADLGRDLWPGPDGPPRPPDREE